MKFIHRLAIRRYNIIDSIGMTVAMSFWLHEAYLGCLLVVVAGAAVSAWVEWRAGHSQVTIFRKGL